VHFLRLGDSYSAVERLPSDHPDVLADRRFRSANRWPSDLPRELLRVGVDKLGLWLAAAYRTGGHYRPDAQQGCR
jgi:hypothetical protein